MNSTQPLTSLCYPARVRRWVLRTGPLYRFAGRRLREASCGLLFGAVFLLCQSPADALVVADIRVLSRLGEPLNASIRFTPAAGEAIGRSCFSTVPASGDLPGVDAVKLALGRSVDGRILEVRTAGAMREPLSEFVLKVKCPGVPTIVKSFLIMIDPPGAEPRQSNAEIQPFVSTRRQVTQPPIATAPIATTEARVERRVSGARTRTDAPIRPGSRYTVRSGDTLSTIAARVAGRPAWSVWPLSQAIYRGNPGAFLLGDPNVLAEGAVLTIPPLDGIAGVPPAATLVPAPASAAPPAPVRTRAGPASVPQRAAPRSTARPATPTPSASPAPPVEAIAPVVVSIEPLPETMRLTTALLDESRMKIALRASGVLPAPPQTGANPASEPPVPVPPETPAVFDDAAATGRAALPSQRDATPFAGIGWWWLLLGGLLGLTAAYALWRRRPGHAGRDDTALPPRREPQPAAAGDDDRIDGAGSAPDDAVAAAAGESPQPESDRPEEPANGTLSLAGLDFDVTDTTSDGSAVPLPESAALDLELPDESSGQTGQHEVDFELLEKAYSEDYQTEFVDNPELSTLTGGAAPEPVTGQSSRDEDATTMLDLGVDEEVPDRNEDLTEMLDLGADEKVPVRDEDATKMLDLGADEQVPDRNERYYHLEGHDAEDEDTPLPFEAGGEPGNEDPDDDDDKVVNFRRGNA